MARLDVDGNPTVHAPGALPRAPSMHEGPVRARVADWPYEPDVAQIILTDHHMLPTPAAVTGWVADAVAERPGLRAIRTGAMFAGAAAAFSAVGFRTIDTLALLEARLDRDGAHLQQRTDRRRPGGDTSPPPIRTRRLRAQHLPDAAAIDRAAFGDPWGNDVVSLDAISDATPRHRARIVNATHDGHPADGRRIAGFAISGQSGVFGYLQRLAVHPDARRRGVAQALVVDSMRWMHRRGATTAMVNTALDNSAALALYAAAGFRRRHDTLTILELTVARPFRHRPASAPPRTAEPDTTRRGRRDDF